MCMRMPWTRGQIEHVQGEQKITNLDHLDEDMATGSRSSISDGEMP